MKDSFQRRPLQSVASHLTAHIARDGYRILTLVPFAYLIYVVANYAVAVPCLDQWDLVPLLDKMYRGELTLHDLWQQHNEHRILVPKLIMLGLARLTHWNISYELAVNVVLGVAIFGVIAVQIKMTGRSLRVHELRWAIPAMSLVVFSVSQYQNWLWGWQMQMLLNLLAAVGGVVLLANPPFTWRRFTASAMLGVVATYSFANGMTFWLIGLVMLIVATVGRRERKAGIAVWVIVSVLVIGSYLWHYRAPQDHTPYRLMFENPLEYASYVLKYIGSIGAQYPNYQAFAVGDGDLGLVAGLGATVGLCWTGWMLIRRKVTDLKVLLPYFGMSMYSYCSALVTAIGRLGHGSDQAVSSRYCTMAVPVWASLVVWLILLARGIPKVDSPSSVEKQRSRRQPRDDCATIAGWVLVAVIALLTLSCAWATAGARVMSATQAAGQASLLGFAAHDNPETNYAGLYGLHENPAIVAERYPVLLKRRLSVFRNQRD